jgi:hypothetical protein
MSLGSWVVGGLIPGVNREPLKKIAPDPEMLLRLLYRWRDEAIKAGKEITRIAVAYDLLSACRIDNLAGIIDCGIFMSRLFAVHKFGTFELFASVVVGRDARAILPSITFVSFA